MEVWIDGKRVDPNATASAGSQQEVKKVETISANQTFENDGPVEVTGNIEAGATVKIKNGGLTVSGNVGDDARIKVEGGSGASVNIIDGSLNISGGSVTIRGGVTGALFVGGQRNVFNDGSSVVINNGGSSSGLTVKGTIGNGVTLVSDSGIKITNAGDNLHAKADNKFEGHFIGRAAHIESGNSLTAYSVGDRSTLDAGNSLHVDNVGAQSTLESGNKMQLSELGADSRARAGNSFTATTIKARCDVNAGNNLTATTADHTAKLRAGNKLKVTETVGGPTGGASPSSNPRRFDF